MKVPKSTSVRMRGWLRFIALAVIAVPAFAADPGKGAPLYARYCANCHGASGVSVMPGAPNFSRQPREFELDTEIVPQDYLIQTDVVLLEKIKVGKGVMPGYDGILSDFEILDVIAFLRTLQ